MLGFKLKMYNDYVELIREPKNLFDLWKVRISERFNRGPRKNLDLLTFYVIESELLIMNFQLHFVSTDNTQTSVTNVSSKKTTKSVRFDMDSTKETSPAFKVFDYGEWMARKLTVFFPLHDLLSCLPERQDPH